MVDYHEENDLNEALIRLQKAFASAPEPYRTMLLDRLPGLVEHFISKGRDYGVTYQDLGSKGQYAEMHRKMRKLRESVWDGRSLLHEKPEEITRDLFGNVFLMLDSLAREE